ncbi:MAG TPA: PAS domain S-box protein [Syntrophales bacterium]|nr:PAS domain S-box protein [Syntrophales bacterium]
MKNVAKATKQHPDELDVLHQKIEELEKSEARYKRTVEALKKSEEYFRAITQNSSDIILIVNKIGTITYVNPSIERFLGYKPEELIGKSGFNFIVPTDIPRAIYDFGRAILTKDIIIPNSFRVRHKDGSEHVLEGVGNNLLDNSIVAGFVMNVRDITDRRKVEEELGIYRKHLEDMVEERTSELAEMNSQLLIELTERKRVEEAVRKSEERYRLLADNAHDVIWIVGMDMRLIYISPSVLRALGFSVEESMGRTMNEAFTPASFEMVTQVFAEEMAKEASSQYDLNRSRILEIEMFHRDGSIIPFEVHYSFLRGADGRPTGILAIARDITERKRAEDEKRHREKLQSSLEIAGAICHEMNQPMQIISGYVELLMKDLSGNHPLYERLGAILTQIERMSTITARLMTIKNYETKNYMGKGKILDIDKSSGNGGE